MGPIGGHFPKNVLRFIKTCSCFRSIQDARRNTPLRHLLPLAEDRPPPYVTNSHDSGRNIIQREKIVLKVWRFQHHSHVESINNNFCWFLLVSVESIDVNVKINLLYNLVMRLSQLMVWRSWFTQPLYPSLRPRPLLQPMKKHCSDNRLSDSQTQRLPPDYLLRMRLLLECL